MNRSILLAFVGMVCALALPAAAADSPCADCHDEVAAAMANQVHMRIEPFEVFGRQVGCEGCHGDGIRHMEEGDPALIRTFANPLEDAEVCLDCHSLKEQGEWHASTHAIENIGCLDCHAVHRTVNPLNTCKDCHQQVYAQFQLPSHHPVPEGKMSCVSCHDPHAATEAQLKTQMRRNDLCYECHQGQEGPFIFEHAPVVEDCSLCHNAHGSIPNNLLTANEPTLCLQCHEFHFHAGLISPESHEVDVGGTEFENPFGAEGMNLSFTTRCTQCHSQIHGTDLPSQSIPSAGFGMVR
jgi:DmsE family decaheme c-type cytochrome